MGAAAFWRAAWEASVADNPRWEDAEADEAFWSDYAHDRPHQPALLLVDAATERPYALAEIYDASLEAACRAAYQKDYMMFGYGPWADG